MTGKLRSTLLWLAALLVVAFVVAVIVTRVLVPAMLPEVETAAPSAGMNRAVEPDVEPRVVPHPSDDDEPQASAILISDLLTEADGGGAEVADGDPVVAVRERDRRSGGHGRGSKVAGIHALGPRSFVIRRSWLEDAMKKNPGVSASPHEVNGKIKGFRLHGVSGGPLGRIGLRSGDVLSSVNGHAIDSPDAGLAAFQRFRKSSRLRLVVLRGGAPVSLSYRIEEDG